MTQPTPPTFTVEAICEAGQGMSGHSDFGSQSYLAPLEALCHAAESEAGLTDLGRMVLFGQIAAALANRLTVVAWEKAHPDAASAPLRAPLVILGLGRTGTTILQETLAAAPGWRTPLTWEITNMSLAHDVADPYSDPRVEQIDENIAQMNAMTPGFEAIHFYDAHTPSECVALTALDLMSEQFSGLAWMPSYRAFMMSQDHRSACDWHRRALRYLQATTPEVRWVLKAPNHSAYLGAFLDTYPDAMVVNPHRHPAEVVASLCSLYATLRKGWAEHGDVEKQALGDATYAAEIIQRAVDYRREHPDFDATVLDLAFTDFMADPDGTLASIFEHFGLELDDGARDAMRRYLDNRPREKYGKHQYTLGEFGLTPDQIARMFAGYIERFGQFFHPSDHRS
jgi:LPS sulfotransferase NodH